MHLRARENALFATPCQTSDSRQNYRAKTHNITVMLTLAAAQSVSSVCRRCIGCSSSFSVNKRTGRNAAFDDASDDAYEVVTASRMRSACKLWTDGIPQRSDLQLHSGT